MKHLSLLTLLREGALGPVRIGSSRESITALLGPPSDVSTIRLTRSGPPAILKYGDVEFHFGSPSEQHLTLIHADVFTGPGGTIAFSALVSLDPWVLCASLSVPEFAAAAAHAGLLWEPMAHPDPELIVFSTVAGGQVGFYADPPAGESAFLWFSLTESAA